MTPRELLEEIARQLNTRAVNNGHRVGHLREIRSAALGVPQNGVNIFWPQSIFDHYAFHWGGKSEFQFNFGFEDVGGERWFRYGAAFSMQRTRDVEDPVAEVKPRIDAFNAYMAAHHQEFADFHMWHWDQGRSQDYRPHAIPDELVREGVFLFMGRHCPPDRINYDLILSDFDRLMPIYEYTVGYTSPRGDVEPDNQPQDTDLRFVPGCRPRRSLTRAGWSERVVDVELRHNDLQRTLYSQLVGEHPDNVGTEIVHGGGRIDLVVRRGAEYDFYEIKVADSARACLRQALGQLLEYAYWPGSQRPSRLVVVGEPELTRDGDAYVEFLRSEFRIPVEYRRITTASAATGS